MHPVWHAAAKLKTHEFTSKTRIDMSPKEQAKRDGWRLFMTTTNELFLPSRITYRVLNPLELVLKFQSLRSMIFEPHRNRWAWNYEFEARTLGFPDDYDRIPPERQPVVLAFCYLTAKDTLQVFVRSTLRLRKALLFFEEHVPRACAIGESYDEYNLLTAHDSRKPIPVLEDFFRDESKIVFIDIEAMTSDPAKFATESFLYAEKSLEPLERHVFEAFYEDGDRYMEMAMRMRELLALKQYGSETPIRPYDFYQEILQNTAHSAGSDASGAQIEGQHRLGT